MEPKPLSSSAALTAGCLLSAGRLGWDGAGRALLAGPGDVLASSTKTKDISQWRGRLRNTYQQSQRLLWCELGAAGTSRTTVRRPPSERQQHHLSPEAEHNHNSFRTCSLDPATETLEYAKIIVVQILTRKHAPWRAGHWSPAFITAQPVPLHLECQGWARGCEGSTLH